MKIPDIIITREHGSWAVLLLPMVIGCVYADSVSLDIFFFMVSSLGIFMSYVPFQILLRKRTGKNVSDKQLYAAKFWVCTFFSLGIIFLLPLLYHGMWLLLLIGGIGILSFFANYYLMEKEQKSMMSDFVAVIGLTQTGPSAYYILTLSIDTTLFVIWVLNILFFGCSVFYVHMKIRAVSLKKSEWRFLDKITIGKWNILYHCAVFLILNIMIFYHLTVSTILAAYLPMIIHALYGTLQVHKKVKFKKLGLALLSHSLAFVAIVIALLLIKL